MKLYLEGDNKRKREGIGSDVGISFKLNIGNKIIASGYLEKELKGYALYFTTLVNDENNQCVDYFISDEELKSKKLKTAKCNHKWRKMDDDVYYCQNCDATKDSDGGVID